MKITGITLAQAEKAAAALGFKLYNADTLPKDKIKAQIRPTEQTPVDLRKVGFAGRKVNAITWEGHGLWLIELFKINPNAVIESSPLDGDGKPIKYKGSYGFETYLEENHNWINSRLLFTLKNAIIERGLEAELGKREAHRIAEHSVQGVLV